MTLWNRCFHARGIFYMKPMLDPKRDLVGATPEKLARALFRPLRPRPGGKPVIRNKVAVQKIAPDKASNRVAHLGKRS